MPRLSRPLGMVLLWLVAAAVAVTVGVLAVTTVGDSLRERGPLGNDQAQNEVTRVELESTEPSLDPGQPRVEQTFSDEFGEVDVACQGPYAIGLEVRPDRAAGWRVVSFENDAPDDDIDAVFATQDRSLEIEVYCNRGRPTVGEIERDSLIDDE